MREIPLDIQDVHFMLVEYLNIALYNSNIDVLGDSNLMNATRFEYHEMPE